MSNKGVVCAQLYFKRGREEACVVTNGEVHMAYTGTTTKRCPTLWRAIAWLETRGFNIVTDETKVYDFRAS